MGTLSRGERRQPLAAISRVGRSPDCLLRLEDADVSRSHALIWWTEAGWFLRDLGSTNGVYVNGGRISARGQQLGRGDAVGFGSPDDVWIVEEMGPPGLVAVDLATGDAHAGRDGILCLPDDDAPLLTLSALDGEVTLSAVGEADRRAFDQEILSIGERRWQLHVPEVLSSTMPTAQGTEAAEPELTFKVSLDEEHVGVSLIWNGQKSTFPPRAEHYLLLTLARRRIEDRGEGLPEEEAGWVDVEDLSDSLRMSEAHVNVQIHRIRGRMPQLARLGPGGVVERRARNLRISVAKLSVVKPE